eukprot:4124763-Ditylum_brightwellii.AAC.1
MHDKVVIVNTNTNNTAQANSIARFPEGIYWEKLTLQSVPVEEPENLFQAQAPTIPEEEHEHAPLKYNFNLIMEHEAFSGKIKTKV